MSSSDRKKLQQLYEGKVNKAISDAEAGVPPDQLKADVEQIDRYKKLLDVSQGEFTPEASFAIIVAVVCMVIAGYLWSHKVARNAVSLSVNTDSLQGELLSDWRLDNPFRAPNVHMERLGKLAAPNLGVDINAPEGDAWVRLEGGQITVQSLQIDKGALVSMSSDQKELDLFFSRRRVRGKLTVVGKGTISAGSHPDQPSVNHVYNIEMPETLEFEVADPRSIPTRLTLHEPNLWSLGRTPFANLNFALEEVRDVTDSDFVSGIKSGTLTFNDTNWPAQSISERDMLALHRTGEANVEVRGGDATIHVTLNGVVQGVSLGQGDAKRQLGPSLLEYFYSKKTVGFFWGAVVFVWSMIWGIRRTIFR